jgi:hypothetical protein
MPRHLFLTHMLFLAVGSDKLATASMDQSAKLWEVETGQAIRTWNTDSGVRCVSLASGDKRLAVLCDPYGENKNPSSVRIYDTSASSEKPIMVLPMDPGVRVNKALWGPLNKQLITCNERGSILSWDPNSGERTHERCEHEQNCADITFSLDQMTFISASTDMSSIVSSKNMSFCRAMCGMPHSMHLEGWSGCCPWSGPFLQPTRHARPGKKKFSSISHAESYSKGSKCCYVYIHQACNSSVTHTRHVAHTSRKHC